MPFRKQIEKWYFLVQSNYSTFFKFDEQFASDKIIRLNTKERDLNIYLGLLSY